MFEGYKVAVQLSLVNGMTSGIVAITGQFNTLNKTITSTKSHVSELEKQLASLKKTAMIGGAMVAAGGFGMSLLGGPLEAAKQYELAATRFKTLDFGEAVNKEADAFARGAQKFGVSATQMMDALSSSIGMFGELGLAKELAPVIAELSAANDALFGGGRMDGSAIKAIMRFNDMRGLTNNKADFLRGLDLAQRLYTGSGGAIGFNDLENMAKTGGAAFKGLSDEGIMTLASIMQEQGGSRTGTAVMSMYQNLIAGRTTKKTMAALQSAGLVELGQVLSGNINGKPSYSTQITSVKDEELLRTNPGGWLMKYGVEAAKKSGAKTDSEVIAFINNLLSNRTGSNLAATFTTQQYEVMRDLNLVKNAKGAQGTIDLYKGTAAGGIDNFNAKMTDLKIALGQGVLPVLIKVVNGITWLVNGLTNLSNTYPRLTTGLMTSFGVLSALVATGGVVMLAKAAFGALGIAMSFAPVGGAAGLLKIGGAVLTLGKGIAGFAASIMTNPTVLALLAAAGIGYGVGTGIKKGMDWATAKATGRKGETLGGWLADLVHGDDVENAVRGVAPRKGQTVQVNAQINLDGRKVGEAVTRHQAAAAKAPATGGTRFDPTRTPMIPQASWANQ